MKQTAVEWLIEQLAENGIIHSSDIHKAKEMEKEQIIKFAQHINEKCGSPTDNYFIYRYYNETYKNTEL